MPVTAYKTYKITQPKTPQTKIGSCEQAGCEQNLKGWVTTVPLIGAQANFIRNESGRRFREEPGENGLTRFVFYPGQQCFRQHHVLDRPQFFGVRDGDYRGNPTGRRLLHSGSQAWLDDFGEHQLKLKEQQERG